MHSRIFVLTSEVKEVEPIEIPEWFINHIADYVIEQTGAGFTGDIDWLERAYPEVLTLKGNTFTFTQDYRIKYFKSKYEGFMTTLRQLEEVDVKQFGLADYKLLNKVLALKSFYEDEYGFYIYDIDSDSLMPMDEWIRFYSKEGFRYIITQIFDYHY